MIAEVKVPEVGESITEGVLVSWEAEEGALVRKDDPLFELETDKVTVTISAEEAGKLERLVSENETVAIGQVVAKIDTSVQGAESPSAQPSGETKQSKPDSKKKKKEESVAREDEEVAAPVPGQAPDREESQQESGPAEGAADEGADDRKVPPMPPSLRRLIREKGIDPSRLSGVSAEEARSMLKGREDQGTPEEPRGEEKPQPEAQRGERRTRSRMSPIRKRIAQRLVEAQRQAAILTTFNEADMTNLLAWRARYKEAFEKRYEVGLGFMSFFVKAVVDALQTVPELNRQIDGDEIVENHFYDIGVAVSSEKGLVVPVVRDADRLSFAEVERAIADLAQRVRDKKIELSELTGGVFTVSNGGVFGSLLSTPILNPPQSGVLGMHAIKRRPVAIGEQMALRPMMYLALSYDHRVVDGREAVTFLKRVVECVENPERMLLEV